MAKAGKPPKGSSKRKPAKPARHAPAGEAKGRKKAAAPKSAERPPRPLQRSPFGKADLEHFRKKLLERRQRLLQNVTAMEAEALKASDQDFSVDHMADHGSDNYEQDFTLSLVESERRELFEIDQALRRIEDGVYGICEGTGLPIARARLEAIPHARYAVEYQRRIEAGEIDAEEEERRIVAVKTRRKAAEAEEDSDSDAEEPEEEVEEEAVEAEPDEPEEAEEEEDEEGFVEEDEEEEEEEDERG